MSCLAAARPATLALSLLLAAPPYPAAAQTPLDTIRAADLGGLETRSAALMLSAQEAGDLNLSVLAIPLPEPEPEPAAPATSRVVLVVDLGGASLLEGAAGDALILEIYAYAIDAEGGLADTLTRAFRLPLDTYREALRRGGVKFFGHFDLAPGEYSLRALALHRGADRLGLRIVPLTVPSWGDEATPVLLPPLATEPAASWIVVVEDGEPPPPFPLTLDGEPILPATRARIDARSRTGYLLLGRPLSGLRAHLLDADRRELLELGLGDLRAVTGGPPGLEMLAADLGATDLEAGPYRLQVSSGAGIAASVRLVVQPADDAEPLVHPAPATTAATESGRSRRALKRGAGLADVLARVRVAYHRSVAALASHDLSAALGPLIEVEDAELGKGSTQEQRVLAEAELEVARELAEANAEALVPLIRLHEELYRQQHARRHFLLSTHSRQAVANLSLLYLSRNKTPEAAHLVACADVSMAGYLQQSGALLAAREVYRIALGHDPDHPAARIGLAAIDETYADYASAVGHLQRLYGTDPEAPEVRLRLAVNLLRQGSTDRADELLRDAVAAPGADWIAAVASQELARLLTAKGNLHQARGVLEAAVERHPGVQQLRLQLAALLDRGGLPGEARAVLDRLDPKAGREESSPRMRYASMPTWALAKARRHLAEQADQRLAVLTAGIASGARPPAAAGGR